MARLPEDDPGQVPGPVQGADRPQLYQAGEDFFAVHQYPSKTRRRTVCVV